MYRSVVFSTALLLTAFLFPAHRVAAQQQSGTYSLNDNETRIFSLINRERARSGLAQLAWNDQLADLARGYSRTMAREGFFDHIDSEGNSVVERARRSHISHWEKIGENLFSCDPTNEYANLALRGWMHSPSHRDNILDPDWRDTGIGIAISRAGEIYITEVFATD